MRKLNTRFLLYLLASFVVLGGGVAMAHYLQVKHIPLALLKQTQRAEDDNEPRRAISYLERYLTFVPDDAEQRVRLARLLADKKQAVSPRDLTNAYFALEKALALDPSKDDLRRQLVPIALRLQRNKDAWEHLLKLPSDGETETLRGQWFETEKKPEEAIKSYSKAVALDPHQIETSVRLARLMRQYQPNPRDADKVIDAVVAKNPKSWQAYLARWEYRRDFNLDGSPAGTRPLFAEMVATALVRAAAEDVRQALEQGGAGQPEVRLAAAEAAQLQGQIKEARGHLDKALQLHSRDARLYRAYAAIEALQETRAKTVADKKACRARAHSWLRRGVDRLKPPAQVDALWNYIYFLLDGGSPEELAEAQRYIAKIRAARFSPAGVAFLTGRLLFARQQWALAARQLETAHAGMPNVADPIDHMLAHCYQELNQATQRAAVCQRLVERNPRSVGAILELIAALQDKGDLDEALRWTRQLEKMGGAPATVWTDRIHLLVIKARQSGDWQPVKQTLDELSSGEHAGSVELAVLGAEYQTAAGDPKEARKTLEKARTQHPASIEPWLALAQLAGRGREYLAADKILNEATEHFQALPNDERKAANLTELRLARARFWVECDNDKANKKRGLLDLEKDLDRFGPDERGRLLNGLAEAHYRLAHYAEAGRLWKTLAAQDRHRRDLRLRLVLFDLALQGDQATEMDRVLGEIRALEGANGTYTAHAEALRLIWRARKQQGAEQEESLKQASVLLGRVQASQPQWSQPLEALVQIDLMRGQPEQARNTFEQARKLGNRNPLLVRQIAEALRKKGKFKEEGEVYKSLNTEDLLRSDIAGAAAVNALKTRNTAQAIKFAQATVRSDSRDYRDHLWMGNVLARAARTPGEQAQAEKYLRRALELAPTEVEPWTALVGFLAGTDPKEAEELVARARTKVKRQDLPLLLARCFAHLNKVEEARQQFEIAVKARPNDAALLVDRADFYLRRGLTAEAETALRALLQSKAKLTEEQVVWSHTRLALLLSYDKKGNRFGEALGHVALRMQANGIVVKDTRLVRDDSDEIKRCAARVLATQPQWRCREEALRRFEALDRSSSLTSDDRYIMAHLYEAKSDWARAHEQLSRIPRASDRDLRHLTAYVQLLLRHNDKDEARQVIGQVEALVKAQPTRAAEAALQELQARWYEANGEGDKAIALLRARVERKDADPQEVMLLVASLGRQKRFEEALQLLDLIWKCSAEMAGGTSVALLRAARSTDAQRQEVARRLEAASAKEPANLNLLIQLGDVFDLQGDYKQAEAHYARALKIDPDNLMALNNLAWLLAQRVPEKREQALAMVNRAVAVHGPRGELLDTRAVIYIRLGRTKEALADLEEAIKEALTPTRCFHLALAHHKARENKAAARELKRANELGLVPADLHPVEQKDYRNMFAELGRR